MTIKEFLLLSALTAIFIFIFHFPIIHILTITDLSTLISLTVLLVITTSLEKSGYLELFAKKIIYKIQKERDLILILTFLSAVFSCFLTNDITLFILIPLTYHLHKISKFKNVYKTIIFETMAANIGSSLTPIGNPQNLFIWHNWGISFLEFVERLFPMVSICMILLILWIFLTMPKNTYLQLLFNEKTTQKKTNPPMFYFSIILLFLYIIAMETGFHIYASLVIILVYIFLWKEKFFKIKWDLIILFAFILIDVNILSKSLENLFSFLPSMIERTPYWMGIGISQIISNVPATIFISKFADKWEQIVYGVNIGGNGILISSFANIIAIKLAKIPNPWGVFHKYSLPYFFCSVLIVYWLFI